MTKDAESQKLQPGAQPSRRRVMRGLLGVGGLLAAELLPGVGGTASAAALRRPLNLAASAEALTVSFYAAVLASASFHIGDEATATLQRMLAAERGHLTLLTELGATPPAQPFYVPQEVLSDASRFVHTAQALEALSHSAYLSATHTFAGHGQASLAAAAASLAAAEAQHHSVLAGLAGLEPLAELPIAAAPGAERVQAALDGYLSRRGGSLRLDAPAGPA